MVKKKNTQVIVVSEEENVQAQRLLGRYHQISSRLHASKDEADVTAALAEVTATPEGAQIALLKELAKEKHTDAADVLTALYEVSPLKNVRKEARRSLIRLEGMKIHPGWEPPVQHAPAISSIEPEPVGTPSRFWKGVMTDSLNIGEIQLRLMWELEENDRDVRVFGFLLEYGFEGVKDFYTRIESKRSFERMLPRMNEAMADIGGLKSCSLEEGRRLLIKALNINKKMGTLPHRDYLAQQALVEQLIVHAPDLVDEHVSDEESESADLPGTDPLPVVATFITGCFQGEPDNVYDLLSQDSHLHAGLSKEEWVEQRKDWFFHAEPEALQPSLLFERKPQKTKLWLPSRLSSKQTESQIEIEAGWSVEMHGMSLNNTLPEVPEATAVYEETHRHWFWAIYTLVRENGLWRIQNVIDAGKEAQNLSVKELRNKISELYLALRRIMEQHNIKKFGEAEGTDYADQLMLHGIRSIYYNDILLKKDPLDAKAYDDASTLAVNFQEYERALVYLIPQAQLFPDQRGETLRRMSIAYRQQGEKYDEDGDDERSERCDELAEEALEASLAIASSFSAHLSLAEMLIERNERLGEAEDHLRRARALATDAADEAHIEMHLAEIAESRGQFQEAQSHYQRIVDLKPNSAEAWADLGSIHEELEQFEDAERCYMHAIELEPDNTYYYDALSTMYLDENQPEKALASLDAGLKANPDDVNLHASMAAFYARREDYRQAELFLKKAEQLDPEAERVITLRSVLKMITTELPSTRKSIPAGKSTPAGYKMSRPAKHKKRRR